MTTLYDHIIVGAGSAGCVLAYRLSENPNCRVLLLEAGPSDFNPMVWIPKGFAKLLGDPKYAWHFPIEPEGGVNRPEVWVRGKMLGGSSSINGMMYVRGQPQDFDDWAANGAPGWEWAKMLPCFRQMEKHQLGESSIRGGDGLLRVSARPKKPQDICEAVIASGVKAGLPLREDLNTLEQEGIGYLPSTIHNGRRWSAAHAFLRPAKRRPNLRIVTNVFVDKIVFDGLRATGVACTQGGKSTVFSGANIILSAGAIQSPHLLQLSGIGPAEVLRAAGVPVVKDVPGVGANLREHRLLTFQYRLRRRGGYNSQLRGPGLLTSILRYLLFRSGPIATGAYDVGAFIKTRPDLDRCDAQILAGPYTVDPKGTGMQMEREPGLRLISYPMRPESQGELKIVSPDSKVLPKIRANYLTAEYDRQTAIGSVRFIRRLAAEAPIADLIASETAPGPAMQTDEDIVTAFKQRGGSGLHTTSTCKMGQDAMAVVDERLRVRGVSGLQVMDCSVMPTLVSGNTNAPVMAMAWRAADLIQGKG